MKWISLLFFKINVVLSFFLCPLPIAPTFMHCPSPPPLASPAVQQQCGRWSWEPAWAVPRSDLPGVTSALPPAGCPNSQLWCAAAAISVQLGRACQVGFSDKDLFTAIRKKSYLLFADYLKSVSCFILFCVTLLVSWTLWGQWWDWYLKR